MKLFRFFVIASIACLSTAFLGGCSDDEGVDNRDLDYGYVQFKLYKEASYDGTRAVKPQLDYLSEASKVKVTLYYNEQTIAQTLTLSAADKPSAEFGLRSEKLKLLTGSYQIITFSLYDANDELLYNGTPLDNTLEVVSGGLSVRDLTVNVAPRGKVRFRITKDMSGFHETPGKTRAVEREYTFDEIAFMKLTVKHRITNEQTVFDMLPTKFTTHFKDDTEEGAPEDKEDGYQTSTLTCDTLLSLKAGDYTLASFETYDKNKLLLETNNRPAGEGFSIEDNKTTKTDVKVTLYEADEYIRDYYALYQIWKALDGENWYYRGESFVQGANWDFNKDPDMWGNQPGVELHSNGRVAKIDISEFGFRGHLPAAIGQFSELIELALGTHGDTNLLGYDPSLALDKSLTERKRTRMERNKAFLELIHTPTQVSEPIAFALAEHNISIPATSLYKEYSEDEIIDRKTGLQKNIRPYDVIHGKLVNGLKSVDPAIGKLQKLESLNIANGELESLPDEIADLKSLTDLEIYNCPKMIRFPMGVAAMPELISLNISNNAQWSPEELYKGLDAIANGPSKEKLQILYATNNKLKEVPESFSNLKKIGLLDLSKNQIETIHPFGKEVAPVQLYLDNNNLTHLPVDSEGYFCNTDDTETFSVTYNKLAKVPNIFSAKSKFGMKSVDFSYNEIDGFEGEDTNSYKGIRVSTFTLSGNPRLTKFPKCFAQSNSMIGYIVLRACSISEFPKGCFDSKNSAALMSLDLSYNALKELPEDFTAEKLPYFYGIDVSYNAFDKFPWGPLDCKGLTVFSIRGQRDAEGRRCLREWPTGIYKHTGLRGFYIGSNDLRKIDDTISYLIYQLDISDNPNITFDASEICYYWKQGVYTLIYDKTQNILNCDKMLE